MRQPNEFAPMTAERIAGLALSQIDRIVRKQSEEDRACGDKERSVTERSAAHGLKPERD